MLELALLSFLPILLTGVALDQDLDRSARSDARNAAIAAARTSLVGPVEDALAAAQDDQPVMAVAAQRSFDRLAASAHDIGAVDRVIVRDAAGRIVYSNDHRIIGRTLGSEDGWKAALANVTDARPLRPEDTTAGFSGGPELRVTTPLLTDSKVPTHALEMWLPQQGIDAAADRSTSGAKWALRGLLALLWALVAGLLWAASRHLGSQAAKRETLALSDPLTGLPNRAMFQSLVDGAIANSGRRSGAAAVMLMDLDRFKDVNDTLGHHNGDLLLQRVASRLDSVLRNVATVARLSGDEFGILVPGAGDRQAIDPIARRILKVLEEPVAVGGLALQVEASIGIALIPEHGRTTDAVMRAADVAMYVTKENHSGYEFYDEQQHEGRHDAGRLALIGELRRAMDEAELVLHYQPKINLRTGRAEGVEALARWQHPERGLLSPAEFIPLTERSNLLRPMTLYLIDSALRQCKAWHTAGIDTPVSVNLSMQSLRDLRLPNDIARLIKSWRLPAGSLSIEITESAIMADPRRALTVLNRLAGMGVHLSIDDFGTGYSSLSYLQELPVGEIKIDKSFVTAMQEDGSSATIVQSTIQLGHDLDLRVVAEGVEDYDTYGVLAELGCDYAQGYAISRPLPADKATTWLEAFSEPPDEGAPATDEIELKVPAFPSATAPSESPALT